MPVTAEKFGKVVGLKTDGSVVEAWRSPVEQLEDAAQLIIQDVDASYSSEQHHSYLEEFISLFYLSLVKSTVEIKPTPEIGFNLMLWCSTAYFAMACLFIRRHPEHMIGYYVILAEQLMVQEGRVGTSHGNSLLVAKLARTFFMLDLKLKIYLPAHVDFPPLPPSEWNALRSLARRFESSPKLSGFRTSDGPNSVRSAEQRFLLTAATVKPLIKAERETHIVAGICATGLACELAVRAQRREDKEDVPSSCEITGALLVCARCKTVKYCSKKHQRADWKRHLKVCFPPTW